LAELGGVGERGRIVTFAAAFPYRECIASTSHAPLVCRPIAATQHFKAIEAERVGGEHWRRVDQVGGPCASCTALAAVAWRHESHTEYAAISDVDEAGSAARMVGDA